MSDLKTIASQMVYAGKDLHDALDNEMKNERTALELAMMTLGSLAEEAGLGDDVARWVSNGVANQRKRDNPGPNVQRVPVTRWHADCNGRGCEACDQTGKVTS